MLALTILGGYGYSADYYSASLRTTQDTSLEVPKAESGLVAILRPCRVHATFMKEAFVNCLVN